MTIIKRYISNSKIIKIILAGIVLTFVSEISHANSNYTSHKENLGWKRENYEVRNPAMNKNTRGDFKLNEQELEQKINGSQLYLSKKENIGSTKSIDVDNYKFPTNPKLKLGKDEHIVPYEVFRALYLINSGFNVDKLWNEHNLDAKGCYITHNPLPGSIFDPIASTKSKKKLFYETLGKRTNLTKSEIDNYYQKLTTIGNIILTENVTMNYLFHERVHKYIDEELGINDKNILKNSSKEFVSWAYKEYPDKRYIENFKKLFPEKKLKYGNTSFAYQNMDVSVGLGIQLGGWSELYAHLAEHQIYPRGQVKDIVYDELKQRHPEAFRIYIDILHNVLEQK